MRYLYAPAFFFGFIGLALYLVGEGVSLVCLPALLPLAILLAFLAERWWPYRSGWNQSHGDGARDLLHALVNETLNALGIAAIPLLALWLPHLGLWPAAWPLALQLLAALLIADLGITLVHYASHRSPLLWRLHAVHHSVTRMYGFNGLMKHPLHQMLEALGGTLPLLLLGIPGGRRAAGFRHRHPVAAAAQQRGHAYRPAAPSVRLGAAAPSASPEVRHGGGREFRAVLQLLGSPAGHRPVPAGLPSGRG